jgi:hypothetical protein
MSLRFLRVCLVVFMAGVRLCCRLVVRLLQFGGVCTRGCFYVGLVFFRLTSRLFDFHLSVSLISFVLLWFDFF